MPVFNIGVGEPFRTPTLHGSYPADTTVPFTSGESKSATFEVRVTDAGSPASHTFQWYVNGSAVSGATASTYTKTGLSAAGSYTVYCRVTNAAGTVQSRTATLSVVEHRTPVLNASLPADSSISVVENATGSVTFKTRIATAGSPNSYTYQWYFNGAAVSGANAASYTRTGLTAGTYKAYCVVSNAAGSVTSRTATLTVTKYTRPVLNTSYPANVSVLESSSASATFKVAIATAGNPASYTYQWYVNNAAVSGATASSYTKTGLTAAGTYTVYCKVTNAAGTVQSRTATLTVGSAFPTYTYSGTAVLNKEGGYNWNIQLKTSGTLKFTSLGNASNGIDVFCVGGGGGAPRYCGGAGGGYTKTQKGVSAAINTSYTITIGAGGASKTDHSNGGDGGKSSAFGVEANGGKGAIWADIRDGDASKMYAYRVGADGGSGGGGYLGTGGEDGADGTAGESNRGGKGQGTTTRAFGESKGTLYSSGGDAPGSYTAPAANTGDGAPAGISNSTPHNGGSGIVIIRNKR